MRTLLTILFILIARSLLFSCNCVPPFPNLRNESKDSISKENSFLFKRSDVAGVVKIIDIEETRIIVDSADCFRIYKLKINKKNIDPKYTSFEKYLEEQSSLLQMRKYKAIVIKEIKASNVGDTIYLYSDYSNCGIYFNKNVLYEIYGFKLKGNNYSNLNATNPEVFTIPMNSFEVSICSAKSIN